MYICKNQLVGIDVGSNPTYSANRRGVCLAPNTTMARNIAQFTNHILPNR